ncbi:MAG: hypothetical protein JWL72_3449 [Ilumatobacteraceae bacterium]|nr:hypothetical protein [Ilumatobacteraceae bacterium]
MRGDVVGIEILERGGGSAIDELVVSLPDEVTRELLLAEIAQVDGVAVEDVRPIDPLRPDAGMLALEIGAALVETEIDKRLDVFCESLQHLVDGSWSLAMRTADGTTLVERGTPPDRGWLAAFFAGSRHIPATGFGASAPGDVVWCHLDRAGVSVAAGRDDRPFHTRERLQVGLLGRIVDGLLPAALDGS